MSWKDILKQSNMRVRMDNEIHDSIYDSGKDHEFFQPYSGSIEPFKLTVLPKPSRFLKGKKFNIRRISEGVRDVNLSITVDVDKEEYQEFKKLFEKEKGYQNRDDAGLGFIVKDYKTNINSDTFEKEAGGVSFGGHGANPELFNIRYGKKRRKKDGERD